MLTDRSSTCLPGRQTACGGDDPAVPRL